MKSRNDEHGSSRDGGWMWSAMREDVCLSAVGTDANETAAVGQLEENLQQFLREAHYNIWIVLAFPHCLVR